MKKHNILGVVVVFVMMIVLSIPIVWRMTKDSDYIAVERVPTAVTAPTEVTATIGTDCSNEVTVGTEWRFEDADPFASRVSSPTPSSVTLKIIEVKNGYALVMDTSNGWLSSREVGIFERGSVFKQINCNWGY